MKKRTRVVAWIFLVYSAGSCLLFFPVMLMTHWRNVVPGVLWSIQWPLWIGLIGHRKWAWRPLATIYIAMFLFMLQHVARLPGFYAAHPGMSHRLPMVLMGNIGATLVMTVLPLIILLTDRPSGWRPPTEPVS